MLLTKYNLKNANPRKVTLPSPVLFDLPEKVLQFGTGSQLRALPDYFIDKANRKGKFNGRIVVVKTSGESNAPFDRQDGLYTLCIRGIVAGKKVDKYIISSAISRVLSAQHDWDAILKCAHNPQMQVIISNTTETGIHLEKDDIRRHPPQSFPGKLLAFLYERFRAFAGSEQSGMVIVPTEMINDNGRKLEAIVLELAHLNSLEDAFIEWLERCNHFCNSLADRIVPGEPDAVTKREVAEQTGLEDELVTMAEAYGLWSIEGDKKAASILSFVEVDGGVEMVDDLNYRKELKMRLLIGTYVLTGGIAFFSGISNLGEAMRDPVFSTFLRDLVFKEIARTMPGDNTIADAEAYAHTVLERFSNPYIQVNWTNTGLDYTYKMKSRVVPLIAGYYARYNAVPENIATCFAAYLLYMRSEIAGDEKCYGKYNGNVYPISDMHALTFNKLWKKHHPATVVSMALSNISLWGTDLTAFPGFEQEVAERLIRMMEKGIKQALRPSHALV